jgi:alanyl-tRNA synthetase
VGFHLGEELTTLDFDGELSPKQVEDLELKANEIIYENLPVQVLYPSKEEEKELNYRSKIEIAGQVRVVEIPGVDLCACCAPHVKTTAEVGIIKILSCDRHRGGCRLTIVCGKRGLKDYQRKQVSVGKISAALSAKPENVAEAVSHLQEQMSGLREQLNRIQAMYLQGKLEAVGPEDKYICIFEESMDSIAMRNFVNDAMERCAGICGAFIGTDEKGYHYILGSKAQDVREIAKTLNGKFSGKGGGKPQMVQGSLNGSEKEIRDALAELV